MTVSAKSLTACWIPPEVLMLLMLHIFVLEKSPNVAGFFFFFNWLEESTCRLSSSYCLPVWRKRARASRLRWKESSFCMFLHHFDTLTVGELKHGKSPVPSISSQCCWQLWQLTAWVFLVFFTLKSCSLCPHTVSVVAQLLSISVFPLFPFTVTYLNLKLSFNSLSNSPPDVFRFLSSCYTSHTCQSALL